MIAAGGMYAVDFAVAKMDTTIAVLIKTMSSVLDNMCTLYAAKKAAGGVGGAPLPPSPRAEVRVMTLWAARVRLSPGGMTLCPGSRRQALVGHWCDGRDA